MKWTPAKTIVRRRRWTPRAGRARGSRPRGRRRPGSRGPGSCAPGSTASRSAASRRTSARQASHWSSDQVDAVGCGEGGGHRGPPSGVVSVLIVENRREQPSIPVVTSVWSSPERPAYPHHALAVVLQVRAARLHVMLWRRAAEPFAGAWALPGGPLLADETLGASVARQLASKVEVRQLAHLEQLETRSDPGPRPARADGGDRLPGADPLRPRPGAARGHRLAPGRRPADDGVRPRLDRRARRWPGCGRSSRTRTSGSRWPRRRSRSPSCGRSTWRRSATR